MRKSALLKMHLSMVNSSYRDDTALFMKFTLKWKCLISTKITHLDFANDSSVLQDSSYYLEK